MAVLSENSLLTGISGSIDGMSFKKCKKKTVVSRKSAKRKKDSPLQKLFISKFAEASKYARAVLRDPEKREYYRQLAIELEAHSAYNLLISEFMLNNGSEAQSIKASAPGKENKAKKVAKKAAPKSATIVPLGTKASQTNPTGWVYATTTPYNIVYTVAGSGL
jgi:hypothetical protein